MELGRRQVLVMLAASAASARLRAEQPIEVIERAAWGAAAPGSDLVPHRIERLTFHHTAVALIDTRLAPERLRQHQAFHQGERGWPDLAYHFAIDTAGHVYEGRDLAFRGDTATSYDPTGHLLVVLEGDFDRQPLGPLQRNAAIGVMAWAWDRYQLDRDRVAGHGEFADTSCPGAAIREWLQSSDLPKAVREVSAGGSPRLVYLRGDTARFRVARIERPGTRHRIGRLRPV
ncbi:MAG TPA: N-acetylmuramoyl-L-alanine amidase [Acidimicrobiia bacterium]|jgi:hypothetical protein